MVTGLYWAALSRAPTPQELAVMTPRIETAKEECEALQDIEWALLNSKEFVFRR
jgi:hypothetical protein